MSIRNLLINEQKPWLKIFIESLNINDVNNNQVLVTDGSKHITSVPFSTFQGAPVTPFSVGAGQAFSSINAAITAAVIAGFNDSNRTSVYIVPGTYVEDVIMSPGISLSSFNAVGCIITGKFNCNVNGSIEFANLTMRQQSDVIIDINGSSSCSVTFNNCVFEQFSTNYIFVCSNTNAGLFLSNCSWSHNAVFDIANISAAGALFMKNNLVLAVNGSIILGNISSLSILQSNVLACKIVSTNTSNINVLFGCIVVYQQPLSGGSVVTVTGGGQIGLIQSVIVGSSPTDFAISGDGNLGNSLLKFNTGILSLDTTINGIPNVINLLTL